jgi:hypothetical protein
MQPSADTILTEIITLSDEIIATFGQLETLPLANENTQEPSNHYQLNGQTIGDKTIPLAQRQGLKQSPISLVQLTDDEFQAKQTLIANIVAQREELVHQLFSRFTPDILAANQEKMATMQTLDKVLIEKANQAFNQAKAEVLSLKKSKKAINSYQNR